VGDAALNKIFIDGCGYADKDEVIVIAKVRKANKTWHKEKLISSDEQFSAMQKATAFPISCVASLMAEGKMEGDRDQHRDYYTQYPKTLSYADIPYEEFEARLTSLLEHK
jgi:saccharopine dehydrogenase-like NADP-dependent oxidoreductase